MSRLCLSLDFYFLLLWGIDTFQQPTRVHGATNLRAGRISAYASWADRRSDNNNDDRRVLVYYPQTPWPRTGQAMGWSE
jgi:hypothetical protein